MLLKKRYGATMALAGLDLDLRAAEILGVAGPNGAGKTTMVKVIAGEEGAGRRRDQGRREALVR